MFIESLGWNSDWNDRFTPWLSQGCEPARVTGLDRERCTVLDASGREFTAEVAGRLRHAARGPADFPAVGDWVALEPSAHDGPRRIAGVLPRATAIVRNDADEITQAQVLAANVDTAFVVAGLDLDFNLRRLERYLATAWNGGVQPVIVLNKADLADELEARIAETEAIAPGVPVVAVSATRGSGLAALEPWLGPGRTVVLLGSSGVGKSTIVNALLGEERQATSAVREHDSRGRHTTTRRELVALGSGAWLLDTPGLRLLKLWADEESLDASFPEIAELAADCRFRDCRHESEPGCAVRAAEARGELPAGRLESWHKLQRELRYLAGRQDRQVRAAEQARWKSVSRSMRQREKIDPKLRRNGGSGR